MCIVPIFLELRISVYSFLMRKNFCTVEMPSLDEGGHVLVEGGHYTLSVVANPNIFGGDWIKLVGLLVGCTNAVLFPYSLGLQECRLKRFLGFVLPFGKQGLQCYLLLDISRKKRRCLSTFLTHDSCMHILAEEKKWYILISFNHCKFSRWWIDCLVEVKII